MTETNDRGDILDLGLVESPPGEELRGGVNRCEIEVGTGRSNASVRSRGLDSVSKLRG